MNVFCSYAREDAQFALRLASDLRNAGLEVWIDQLDIKPGEHWDSAVEGALKRCPAFLVVLSPRSVVSRNVMDEVHYAIEEGKKILPIMHEQCDLPFRLRRLQYIEFNREYGSGLRACVAYIGELLDSGGPGQSALAQYAPPAARDGRSAVSRVASRERLDAKRFLWVDDSPSNNRYERRAFEDLGAEIHLAIDTADALLIAREVRFDLILSDMGRPSGQRAGYKLLEMLRTSGIGTPFVIYSGSNSAAHKAEAKQAGAAGCTNNPHELLDLVMDVFRTP